MGDLHLLVSLQIDCRGSGTRDNFIGSHSCKTRPMSRKLRTETGLRRRGNDSPSYHQFLPSTDQRSPNPLASSWFRASVASVHLRKITRKCVNILHFHPQRKTIPDIDPSIFVSGRSCPFKKFRFPEPNVSYTVFSVR
jgi:hypothetical protein